MIVKVIFLDIDGVLTSRQFEQSIEHHRSPLYRFRLFSQEAILNLHDIVWETGAYLVLSSSWRYEENETHAVQKQLNPYNLKLIGMTTIEGVYHEGDKTWLRGHEIQQWLDEHPDVDNYVILDDDNDMLDSQMSHYVQCSWETGLTNEMKWKAIRILNGVNYAN